MPSPQHAPPPPPNLAKLADQHYELVRLAHAAARLGALFAEPSTRDAAMRKVFAMGFAAGAGQQRAGAAVSTARDLYAEPCPRRLSVTNRLAVLEGMQRDAQRLLRQAQDEGDANLAATMARVEAHLFRAIRAAARQLATESTPPPQLTGDRDLRDTDPCPPPTIDGWECDEAAEDAEARRGLGELLGMVSAPPPVNAAPPPVIGASACDWCGDEHIGGGDAS